MNKKNFIKILQKADKLSKKDILFLEEISHEFPYFQPSRAIYLKSLAENEDIKFKKYLKSTAVYTRDRKILFDFIKNIQNQNEKVFFNKNEIASALIENEISNSIEISEHNSFVDWLKLSNLKPIDRDKEAQTIDKFISKKPKIKIETNETQTDNYKNDDLANQSGFMTETLAKLYLNQKNYVKAIQSYKILILKFPEKSSYFANQIKKIQKLKK
tara:strand:- start:329 stop:973 length:645 start_codon:yes stop_codon:yes gene_type:complete